MYVEFIMDNSYSALLVFVAIFVHLTKPNYHLKFTDEASGGNQC